LLRRCAARAARLTCIHALDSSGGEARLVALLNDSGWRILETARRGGDLVCHCEAAARA
jgi:hypothetical protein